jgi:sec-independent protein translocase protein TatA
MGEMVLIFLVVLLLFGAKRIPEIGTSLGSGIREFKKSMKDVETAALRPADNRYVPPPVPETPSFARVAEAPAAIPAQTAAAPVTPQA